MCVRIFFCLLAFTKIKIYNYNGDGMLKICNLTKYYKNNLGVKEVNIELEKGEIFGFIGPNGAGKSTTIKCILNFLNKNNGELYLEDKLIEKKDYLFKKDIGYLPSEIHLYEDLKVREMINYSKSFYNKKIDKRIEELVSIFEIELDKRIDELSYGNLKKVGIILALMHEPKLLILDEPTSGLDPLMQEKFFEVLLKEKQRGATIFFSSHNLSEIKKVCDRVGIIKNGTVIEVDTVKNLSKNNFVVITIKSKDVKKINLPLKNMHIKTIAQDELIFTYNGDINKLINVLNEYKIDKLLIEEMAIDDIFMHYYKEV